MRQGIFRDFLTLSSARVVNVLLTMIQAMLFVRAYSIEEYGMYVQFVLITGLATIIFGVSVENSINYFLSTISDLQQKKHFISQMMMLTFLQGFFCAGVLFLFKPEIIGYFQNEKLESVFIIIAMLPLFSMFKLIFEVAFIALNKTRFAALSTLVMTIMQLSISIIFFLNKYNMNLYLLCVFLLNLFFTIFIITSLIREINGFEWGYLDKKLIVKVLKYAVPIWLAGISAKLNVELDKLFIGRYLGTEQLAIYANMARELPIAIITGSLTAIFLPKMVGMYKKRLIIDMLKLWKIGIELSWIIVCTSVTFLLIMSSEVLVFLYSEKYLEGLPIFRVYIILLLLRVAYFGIILNVTNNTKYIFGYTVLSLILNVFMVYIFFYLFGTIGPALGTLVSNLVIGGLQLAHSAKILRCGFKSILPWDRMYKILIFNLLISIPLVVINNYLSKMGIHYVYRILFVGILICLSVCLMYVKRINTLRRKLNDY